MSLFKILPFLLLMLSSTIICRSQSSTNFDEPVPAPGDYQSFARMVVSDPNPDIPVSLLCQDLRVIFILDESGSIAGSGATQAVKDGVRALSNALFNSGATLEIIEFNATSRRIDLGLNSVNTNYLSRLEDYLGAGYNGQNYNPAGFTNWHAALIDAEPIPADLVIFFTDGFPNYYIGSGGTPLGGTQQALDSAVYWANLLKAQGKHMFGVGVGPGIDLPNIQAISGMDQFGGTTTVLTGDYTTPPFDELASNLAAVVNTICGTELAIKKAASAGGVCAGETVTFTTTLTNTGGSFNFVANNTVITDVYPDGYSNLEILVPSSGASITGNTVTYPVGNMNPGDTVTLVVKAIVDAPPGNYNNIVTGTAFNANAVKDSATVLSGYATNEIQLSSCGPVTINGQTLSDPGTYTQTLVSAAGCDSVLTIIFTRRGSSLFPIQCSGAGISCVGSCNGRASVTVFGDPANYSITWNTTPPQTTAQISGLCPGTYKVRTIDADGCPDSCSITIPNEPCGNFRTHTQGGYGAIPKGKNVASYMKSRFATVFTSGLTIGCNNKLTLTTWQAVVDFLPSGSTARALPNGTLTNPGQSYQNVLAGQLVAATLNVKFDSAFASFSPNNLLLKDLVIASGPFGGWTVSMLLAEANRAIGGCGSTYSFSALNNALDLFNNNYNLNEFMNSPLNNRCFLSCPINSSGVSGRPVLIKEETEYETNPVNELLVYPNPANEKLNVKYTAGESMKVRIELLSNTGTRVREILNTSMKKGQETDRIIPTNQLTPGMYWIRVMDEYGSQLDIQKVIIQR